MNTLAPRPLIVVGSQRSGTTLLNRVLNAHPSIAMVYQQTDYLREGFDLQEEIETPKGRELVEGIRERVLRYDNAFTDAVAHEIQRALSGRDRVTYSALYLVLLEQLASGGRHVSFAGEKYAGRCLEAFPFLQAFPEGRLIHIVRDVRDVFASEKARIRQAVPGGQRDYHHLITVFDWKAGHRAVEIARARFGPDRVLRVHYESLVNRPTATCRELCSFLGIEFDPSLTQPDRLVDDMGEPWIANSSLRTGAQGIQGRERFEWKRHLDPGEIAFTEWFCGEELRGCGYPVGHRSKRFVRRLVAGTQVRVLASKMKELVNQYSDAPHARIPVPIEHANELALETLLG